MMIRPGIDDGTWRTNFRVPGLRLISAENMSDKVELPFNRFISHSLLQS